MPPTESAKTGKIRGEAIELIVTFLRRIQTEGGKRNLVTFTPASHPNCWIRLVSELGDHRVDAEAASHESQGRSCILNRSQISRLQSLGWQPPRPYGLWRFRFDNFHRQWPASTDADRRKIAHQVMQTFNQVYGIASDAPLSAHLVLAEEREQARQLVDDALKNQKTRLTVDSNDMDLIREIRKILRKLESKGEIVIRHMDSDEFLFDYEGPDAHFEISFPDH